MPESPQDTREVVVISRLDSREAERIERRYAGTSIGRYMDKKLASAVSRGDLEANGLPIPSAAPNV
jgi:hypothetical protein